jgi:hypothetical protein
MNKCRTIQKDLVAYLSGELDGRAVDATKRHLETCASCRQEVHWLEEVLSGARTLEPAIKNEMAAIDWEAQAERIASAAFDKRPERRSESGPIGLWLSRPGFRPVLAGLGLGIVVGALAMYLVFKGTTLRPKGGDPYVASHEFLDRVDLEIARRDTLDYLEKSQYVLLDIVESDSRTNGLAAERARDLLAKKKYLNPQLEKAQMAKAKEICDQIEFLFYELSEITSGLTDDQRRELRSLIEEKNLLLKIRLLKKELQESEV